MVPGVGPSVVVRAVVGGILDDGVVGDAEVVDELEKLADVQVVFDHAIVILVPTRAGAEQDQCRRFPGASSADLRGGPRRNFQVFSALDFLAEVTQHIPDKGDTSCVITPGTRIASAACEPSRTRSPVRIVT